MARLGPRIFLTDPSRAGERETWVPKLLSRMPTTRANELLLAALDDPERVATAFCFVKHLEPAAQREAVRRLFASGEPLGGQSPAARGLRSLGARAPALVAEAVDEQTSLAIVHELLDVLPASFVELLPPTVAAKAGHWLTRTRAICAEVEGPRDRIYLLEPAWRVEGAAVSARPESWSQWGGPGPAGSAGRHILTLDLEDVPELRALLGVDARAVRLVAPESDSPSSNSRCRLVPRTEDEGPVAGGEPLPVIPLSVPRDVWLDAKQRRKSSFRRQLDAIAGLIDNASGRALGQPSWIRRRSAPGPLLLEVSGLFGLNLGDQGRLWLFPDEAVVQSH